jgi:hypothetical protein
MNSEIHPQVYARVGGILYLIMIALGTIEEAFIRGRLSPSSPTPRGSRS